jgi:RNA polymerase primary sigma factor
VRGLVPKMPKMTEDQNKLVEQNINLVRGVLKKEFVDTFGLWDDLFQHGCIGLMRAAQKYDPGLGVKFSTYSYHYIRRQIWLCIMDNYRNSRVPRCKQERFKKVVKIMSKEPSELTNEELKTVRRFKFNDFANLLRHDISLNIDVGLDNKKTELQDLFQGDPVNFDKSFHIRDRKNTILSVLKTLSNYEARVISLRFGLTDGRIRTLAQVGAIIGKTKERVRQIEVEVLHKLRHPRRSKPLREYYS